MLNKKLVYTAQLAIRWGDLDAFGHVNNTEYFRYMEQARIQWLTALRGHSTAGANGPVLINAQCSFLRQLRYPADIVIDIGLGAVGRSSIETLYELRRIDEPNIVYAEGAAKIVWIDFASEKSIALPEKIREQLDRFVSSL